MTHEEAVAWLERAPSWSVTLVRAAGTLASLNWRAVGMPAPERRAACDVACEVAIIAAMWPRAPSDVLAEMRHV